jgi:heterodisulfide reductase subunit A-like polyferredoxin
MSRHILIIGGGPAGIEAATAAAQAGSRVMLISPGPIGGRAGKQCRGDSYGRPVVSCWLSLASDPSHLQ